MSGPFSFTRRDVLRIVQSLAKPLRGQGHAASDAALFTDIATLEGFPSEQVHELALAAAGFFGLDAESGTVGLCRDLCARPALEDWAAVLHEMWPQDAAWFKTSGSTGTPVRHCLPFSLMAEEMAILESRVFSSRSRIVSVMPTHHIFGFMYGMLMGKWRSIPTLYAPPLPLAGFFSQLREGDIIVGFPLFWNALLSVIRRDDVSLRLPPDITGLTATAPCPVELIRGLLGAGGAGTGAPLASLSEIYGSTENMAMGLRRDGDDWFELLPLWEPVALEDGKRGLRRVRGSGARGAAEPFPDDVSWHPEKDRLFRPLRRMDKAVQVGGINVYPERVAAVLRAHPKVRDCAVRLMRPEEGTRLKAFIVPDIPLRDAEQYFAHPSFRGWMAERLETVCRPKKIRLGLSLPVNAMGKASDWD